MALLCLSVTGRTLDVCRRKVEETAVPVDLIELRADFLDTSELPSLPRFPGMVNMPVILTIRKPEDGGKDIFVHRNNVEGLGPNQALEDDESVEFEVEETPKGPSAVNVVSLDYV